MDELSNLQKADALELNREITTMEVLPLDGRNPMAWQRQVQQAIHLGKDAMAHLVSAQVIIMPDGKPYAFLWWDGR